MKVSRGKYRNFGIKNLMSVLIMGNLLVYFLSILGNVNLSLSLALIPSRVFSGEIWRLISYIFIPPTFNPLWLIIILMFYYYIGKGLEEYWGTFKFNLYYFTGVFIGTAISLIFNIPVVGVSDLNMSLFLAYAVLNPENIVYFFMILPIKMKYAAIFILSILGYRFFTASAWQIRVIIIGPIINFIIFFLPIYLKNTKKDVKSRVRKQAFEAKVLEFNKSGAVRHKCVKCGITDRENENMEFRYCSKCNGNYEYCSDHIFDHEHK